VFYSRLYITRLTGGDVIGKFEGLLKNPNNEPYTEQLYYTMGETYRDNYDFQRAIEAYKKVDNPEITVKPTTKAKAVMAIADITLDSELSAEAPKYYEMALGLISPNDKRYSRAKKRSQKFDGIVT